MSVATIPRETKTSPPGLGLELRDIPLRLISVGPNVRTELGDLDELKASIEHSGVLQPIRVTPQGDGTYKLIFGQRRLAAAKLAGLTTIPALVSLVDVARITSIVQLVENLQRRDLGPIEEAKAFQQLLAGDKELSQAELARRIGRSAPYVSNALRILELDAKVLPLVESGQLSGSHAKALTAVPKKEQRSLAARAVKEDLSSHELEFQIKLAVSAARADAEEAAKNVKLADKAEELLVAAGATKEASTLSGNGYYTGGVYKILKGRGWTIHAGFGYRRGEGCTCDAWQLDLDYRGTLNKVLRACVSVDDDKVERTRSEKVWKDKQTARDREAKAAAAMRAKMLKPVVDYVAGGETPFRRRLQLFALVDADYRTTSAFLQHHGSKEQVWTTQAAKVWGLITKLADAKVETELARVLAAALLNEDTPSGLRDSLLKNVPGLKELQPAKKAKAQP
jgi:ParB family chromosome partitioning protein